LLCLFCVICIA